MGRVRTIATDFRGLNVDRPVNRTPSGSARIALNARRWDTELAGRPGFNEWDITNTVGILQVMPFPDGAGDVWVALKLVDATMKVTAAYANSTGQPITISWSTLTLASTREDHAGLSTTDPGSWFIWRDRLYVFDSVGGQKWHPTTVNKPNGASIDCWIPGMYGRIGPIIAAAEGGAKSGWYFVGAAMYNSITREWSCIQNLQSSATYTAFNDPVSATGALTVPNWVATGGDAYSAYIKTDATNNLYEWDHCGLVCTLGSTDYRGGAASPSLRFFVEQEFLKSETADASLKLADEALSVRPRHDNGWGTPPLASCVCCNGDMAVYAGTAADPAMVAISRGGFPCAIPGDQNYTIGGIPVTWKAEPFNGFRSSAVEGIPTGVGWTGERFVVWTTTNAYWMIRRGGGFTLVDSRSWATGISRTGSCSTPEGAYAIGNGEFSRASKAGIENMAFRRFGTLLNAIPSVCVLAAGNPNPRTQSVLAAYRSQQEVWLAVARTVIVGATECVRQNYGTAYGKLDVATSGYTYTYQFFPDAPADNDALYFRIGLSTDPRPALIALYLAIGRPAKYVTSGVMTWEYYSATASSNTWLANTAYAVNDLVKDNGGDSIVYQCYATRDASSSARPAADTTHWRVYFKPLIGVVDLTNPDDRTGGRPLIDDGVVGAASPTDWTSLTVDSVAGYWVRCRIVAGKAASLTRVPMLAPEGPSRIYVYDERTRELVGAYDPRNLRGASIRSMAELALPSGDPIMLIGLSDGRVLSFPSDNYYDSESTATSGPNLNYSTLWEGHIGQESRHTGRRIKKVRTHAGAMTVGVRLEAMCVRTGVEDEPATVIRGKVISLADTMDESGLEFDPLLGGHFVRVRFSTTASETQSPHWEVVDLFVDMEQ